MNKNLKQLKLKGNVLWLQMVSMRDKATGAFNIMMDGNVNNTLHTLAASKADVNEFVWAMPKLNEADKKIIEDYNRLYFDGKIRIIEVDELFGAHAGEHRELWSMLRAGKQTASSIAVLKECNNANFIISDYPISHYQFPDDLYADVIYNFSLTKVSDSDNGPGTSYFDIELELCASKDTEAVYLFSNNQLNYFVSKLTDISKVFRRTNVFSKHFLEFVADYVINNTEHAETANAMKEFTDTAALHKSKKILLWPHRLDDPRYCLNDFITSEVCNTRYFSVLMTNPTNISDEDILEKLLVKNELFSVPITVICRNDDFDKRLLYMFLLSKLSKQVEVWHYESDFHTGTAEQFIMLGENGCVFKNDSLNAEVVKSYITD